MQILCGTKPSIKKSYQHHFDPQLLQAKSSGPQWCFSSPLHVVKFCVVTVLVCPKLVYSSDWRSLTGLDKVHTTYHSGLLFLVCEIVQTKSGRSSSCPYNQEESNCLFNPLSTFGPFKSFWPSLPELLQLFPDLDHVQCLHIHILINYGIQIYKQNTKIHIHDSFKHFVCCCWNFPKSETQLHAQFLLHDKKTHDLHAGLLWIELDSSFLLLISGSHNTYKNWLQLVCATTSIVQ